VSDQATAQGHKRLKSEGFALNVARAAGVRGVDATTLFDPVRALQVDRLVHQLRKTRRIKLIKIEHARHRAEKMYLKKIEISSGRPGRDGPSPPAQCEGCVMESAPPRAWHLQRLLPDARLFDADALLLKAQRFTPSAKKGVREPETLV
jgi:hypothetical protein